MSTPRPTGSARRVTTGLSVAAATGISTLALAAGEPAPLLAPLDSITPLKVTLDAVEAQDGGLAGGSCSPQTSTYTNSDFGAGTYILQGGLAEGEAAAVSFTLTPEDFPLRLDLAEMIFGTDNALVQTTTEWSFLVWEGTPASGTLILQASSQDKLLPPIILPPGTTGVNVQVQVDPGDPEQIIIQDNGTQTFSIGYRVDQHHQQTGNPCFVPPSPCCNAFPATDIGGLSSPSGNWLFAIDCILCPAGWSTFGQLGLCQPSGDWVMRATWTPFNCSGPQIGACCFGDGTCSDTTEENCLGFGGTWQGAGVACIDAPCPPPGTGPCCFPSTGGCLDLPPADCVAAGGEPGALGASCDIITCFPIGACCLPDGSCTAGVSPEACAALDGVFQGDGTSCLEVQCPEPIGACCFDTGFCLELTEANCLLTGSIWGGIGSTCDDSDVNGVPDACEDAAICGDLDGNGVVDGADLGLLLGAWGKAKSPADLNADGAVDGADLGLLLGCWT